jgi:hypothetical protein
MYKKEVDAGLEIVGIEGGATAAEIAEYAKGKGMTYQCCSGGNIKGSNVATIPHTFLFGADGNLIGEKLRLPELQKKVPLALKECGAALAGAGPYTKLGPLAAQIKSGIGLGTVLKTLATKKNSKDAVEVAEATMMYDALHNGGQEQFDMAMEQKSEEMVAALQKFDRLAAQFAGDEIGKKASEQALAMKKDPQVKAELAGEQMWKIIEGLNDKLKPVKGVKDPKEQAFRDLNIDSLKGLVAGCYTIIQRCPKTKAAARAQEYIDDYVPATPAPAKK